MKIDSHPVVVYSMNPETHEMTVVEVTNLLAVPATFYNLEDIHSDEVTPDYGYITLIGGRTFRLRPVPLERIQSQAEGVQPVLEVTVPWDQIDWTDKTPQQEKAEAAPPTFKPDEH